MSDSFIKPGLEMVLAVGPIGGLGMSSAKIASVNENSLTLQTDGHLLFVRPGVLLEVKIPNRRKEGWAQILSFNTDDDRNLMEVSIPRWSDTSRSPRRPADFRVKISYVEPTPDGPKLRQIAGNTSNISMTGAKVFAMKELEADQLYHFEIFFEETEMPCTAVGKVVRLTQGAGSHKDGWELGIRFVRFISGLAEYGKAVGDQAFNARVGDMPNFEDDEEKESQAA